MIYYWMGWRGGAVLALLLVFAVSVNVLKAWHTTSDITITVVDKERVTMTSNGETTSKYLVYTEEETFENVDSIWFGKWNSSDVHGGLREGVTYDARVYGMRVPILSWYRNILQAVPRMEE